MLVRVLLHFIRLIGQMGLTVERWALAVGRSTFLLS